MIYGGPGFLAIVLFGSSRTPLSPPVSNLSLFRGLPVCRRPSLLTREGERGGGGEAKSYDDENAWSSLNLQYSLIYDDSIDVSHFSYCADSY